MYSFILSLDSVTLMFQDHNRFVAVFMDERLRDLVIDIL